MDTTPADSPEPISSNVAIHDKRIVLLVTSGEFAGLHQILGTVTQQEAECGPMPEFIPETRMPPDGRIAPAGLVRMTHRFVLYKECSGPISKRFNELQQ